MPGKPCGAMACPEDIMEYRQEVIKNWILIEQTQDEIKYMRPLFSFVLGQFMEIFGAELMEAELCVVFNEANAPCPMLIRSQDPIHLRVNATSLNHWAQFIYQLSHELGSVHISASIMRAK